MSEPIKQTGEKRDTKFPEGHPGGPGRPKGVHNKTSQAVINDILAAYEEVGGVKYLVELARSKDKKTFCRLLERILPKEINLGMKQSADEWIINLINQAKEPPTPLAGLVEHESP